MILKVENGCFGYPKQDEILTDINIQLDEGHILSVLGPNGIGKTTLLKCMIGLMPWSRGCSLLMGNDIRNMSSKQIWNTISYIPQSHGFSFSYTGLEMVIERTLAASILGVGAATVGRVSACSFVV
mgnify:CR=1 FL=1